MTTRVRVLWAGALVPWLVAALVWAVVQAVSAPAPTDSPGTSPRGIGGADRSEHVVPAVQAAAPGPDWTVILDRLDRRRERAYALRDPHRLRSVYVAGSPVLRHDLAMLRAYRERGVWLTGVRLRVLDAREVGADGPYVRLRVVDRLDRPTAHTGDGSIRMPRDQATARVIVLRDNADGWRIAAVRAV